MAPKRKIAVDEPAKDEGEHGRERKRETSVDQPRDERIRDRSELVAVVRELLIAFKWERWTYLACSVLAFVALIGSAVWLAICGRLDTMVFLALFGSTGVVAVSLQRMLVVMSKVIDHILK